MSKYSTRCFLLHDWGKWEEYTAVMKKRDGFEFNVLRQRRICKCCGKIQDRKILG